MPNTTSPAWRGGARQKVSFWSNGSADNKELISDTQAYCRLPGRVTIALSTGNAWAPLRDRRDDLLRPSSSVEPCSSATITPNVVQRGDALTLLQSLSTPARRWRSSIPSTAACLITCDTATGEPPKAARRTSGNDQRLYRRMLPRASACTKAERLSAALDRHLPSLSGRPSTHRPCLPVRRSNCLGQSTPRQWLSLATKGCLPISSAEAAHRPEEHVARSWHSKPVGPI